MINPSLHTANTTIIKVVVVAVIVAAAAVVVEAVGEVMDGVATSGVVMNGVATSGVSKNILHSCSANRGGSLCALSLSLFPHHSSLFPP